MISLRLAIELNAPADDPGIDAETLLPQPVRQHDDVRLSGVSSSAANVRPNAGLTRRTSKQRRADLRDVQSNRLAFTGQDLPLARGRRGALEDVALRARHP